MTTEYIIEKDNFNGRCQTVIENGKILYNECKTFQEYCDKNSTLKLMLISENEFNTLLDNFLKSLCDDWKQITESEWWDMLECLPPLKFTNTTFYISEATTYNIHAFYCKHGGKYYTSLQPINKKLNLIQESLKTFLKEGEQ